MSYTKHTWQDGETITAAKLNNVEDGIEEAAQSGGGGYDLVIRAVHEDWITDNHPAGLSLSDFEIVDGSISACAAKVANDEPVSAVLYFYNGKSDDYHIEHVVPLTSWNEGYTYFEFSAIDGNRVQRIFSFEYENGSLSDYDGLLFNITGTAVPYNP